ncbi:uncharacterized protein PGTG_04589 [Puccinia graminis f. sp. tritici CRL 75-36-700-3]|uniref:Uncharacterized protein n=1 Tax=Puccinia graminis f. sp. tritici (strain CRL 75-36-700-3 / race SCCL) TaxID=418459 RepID=E3K2R4_PUCGT|nr:uncharacterized protein PGTG_04589 [Puccinia graminis f. sp. tritici CRL 75-36-700-3]EFP78633.2 hypothetical protein PGTG_04589 [Puccinia graminis f. sp. tritici CRL 75-36-700-3]
MAEEDSRSTKKTEPPEGPSGHRGHPLPFDNCGNPLRPPARECSARKRGVERPETIPGSPRFTCYGSLLRGGLSGVQTGGEQQRRDTHLHPEMPPLSKSSHLTPSKQTRKTSSKYSQGSPSNETHEPDAIDPVRRELVIVVETFVKFRHEWDELVLNRSLNLILKIMDLEAEIRSTIQNSCFLQKCAEDKVVLEDGYAWKQFCKMNEHCRQLEILLGDLTKLGFKIQQLNDHFEALIPKSCGTHGIKMIFESPLGLTWPLPQICDHFINLSSQYIHSLQFHHSLYDVIVSQDTSTSEKQAAVSYWACQPLMYDKSELNDFLEVEFPNFFNGPNLTPKKPMQNKH